MKVISVIEDEDVIKKILKHLNLWPVESLKVERDMKARPPPKTIGPPKPLKQTFDYSTSQFPVSDNLSRPSRSNEWVAEGHVFNVIDVEYEDAYPA